MYCMYTTYNMYRKVTITIEEQLLQRTKTWLDGRNMSGLISDLLIGYLDANDFKGPVAPAAFVYSDPLKGEIIGVDPKLSSQINPTIPKKNNLEKSVEKIVKKVNKSEKCRHGIMVGGYCRSCDLNNL